MGASLIKRLSNNKQQVIEDVALFGRFYAMTKWGVKDYVAFATWIGDTSGNPNLGLNAELDLSKGRDLGEQLIEAMANYITKTQLQNNELRERITHLEALLGERHIKNATLAIPILTKCRLLDTPT